MKPRLIMMVKAPRLGRVKTRLARDIGPVEATRWYKAHLQKTIRTLRDPRWDLILATAPEGYRPDAQTPILSQGHGDLGARMRHVFLQMGRHPTCIIGSDILGLTKPIIADAFHKLGSNPAQIGPAPDGGYWLVGLKTPSPMHPSFLKNIRWSGPHAMADTMASDPTLTWTLAPVLQDVDSGADLQKPVAGP